MTLFLKTLKQTNKFK